MPFLDLAAGFDQILGFLEAKSGEGAHFLDHVDLLCAGVLQDDVEFGFLFLCRSAGVAACGAGHHHRAAGGGLDAVFVLEDGS